MSKNVKQCHVALLIDSLATCPDEYLSTVRGEVYDVYRRLYLLYHGRYIISSVQRSMKVEVVGDAEEVSLSTKSAVRFYELGRGMIDIFSQAWDEGLFRYVSKDIGDVYGFGADTWTDSDACLNIIRFFDPLKIITARSHSKRDEHMIFIADCGNTAFYRDLAFRLSVCHQTVCREPARV
jgi:hypothetical protein